MMVLLSVLLSVATFVLLFVPGSARAATSPRPESNQKIALSPEERALILKGKIVLRNLPNPGRKGRTYEAVGILRGSLDEAFAVLTDYGCYADYMPSVGAVRICEATGPSSVVEVKLHLPLGVKKQYRLRYTSTRHESGFEVAWEKLPWPELKPSQTVVDTSGFWSVRTFEDRGLLAVYHVYTDPGHVPLGLTKVAHGVARSKIPDGIAKLRERILRVYRPGKK
ncbi:MAG: hypothetical protein IMZ57_05645 [Acidobacteria bacterium]|nr:hypothetical protein [Acidobacteriota bacterium]